MKPHLILVFFLAMPLIGRLLSSDSASNVETCDASATTTACDAPDATPNKVENKTTTAPSAESHPATAPQPDAKTTDRRAARARAVTFM